jgi:hypothetical protein
MGLFSVTSPVVRLDFVGLTRRFLGASSTNTETGDGRVLSRVGIVYGASKNQ